MDVAGEIRSLGVLALSGEGGSRASKEGSALLGSTWEHRNPPGALPPEVFCAETAPIPPCM